MTRKAPRKNDILGPVGIECPAVELFNAESELIVGRHKIVWTSNDFEKLIRGVVEKNTSAITITERPLLVPATSKAICERVGTKRAIRLAHLAHLLNTKNKSFITVVLVKRNLWAVYAFWSPYYGVWDVDVYSVAYLGEWNAGYRVLSQVRLLDF